MAFVTIIIALVFFNVLCLASAHPPINQSPSCWACFKFRAMHLRPATLRDQRNCVENITTSTASCTCSEVLGLGLMLSESPDLSSGAVQRESVQISQKFCLPRPVHSSGAVQQRESVQISQKFCSILWRFMDHVCGPRFAFVFATVSLPSRAISSFISISPGEGSAECRTFQ